MYEFTLHIINLISYCILPLPVIEIFLSLHFKVMERAANAMQKIADDSNSDPSERVPASRKNAVSSAKKIIFEDWNLIMSRSHHLKPAHNCKCILTIQHNIHLVHFLLIIYTQSKVTGANYKLIYFAKQLGEGGKYFKASSLIFIISIF